MIPKLYWRRWSWTTDEAMQDESDSDATAESEPETHIVDDTDAAEPLVSKPQEPEQEQELDEATTSSCANVDMSFSVGC